MSTIVVDTGPLYAAFDQDDRYHETALHLIHADEFRLVTNLPVICEVVHLLGRARKARLEFLKWAGVALEIDMATAADLPRIVALLAKYHDLRPDFADASLVALCERLGTCRIATVDRDFKVYRTLSNMPFENVFQLKNR
jgi:uncharacterized protein